MACFIALEGIDGAGKTTQVNLLAQRLREAYSLPLLVLHEPGGTPLGDHLHQLLKYEARVPLAPEAELLLFTASRAQLVRDVIRPAQAAGHIVLCDRFSASTLAYQGYGRGLDLDLVRGILAFATGGLAPDLTVLLDVPVSVGLGRKRETPGSLAPGVQFSLFDRSSYDRFHDETKAFYERVREGYLRLAAEAAHQQADAPWEVIDGTPPPEVVAEAIWSVVQPLVLAGNKR